MRNHYVRAAAGGQDLGYVDWGGDEPVFTITNSPTTYQLSDAHSHFGMCTDSWCRYVIIFPRSSNTSGYRSHCIWIPITETGLDLTNRFYTEIDYQNSFGGLVDTVRGKLYQCKYNSVDIREYNLPTTLTGLEAGEFSTITSGSDTDLGAGSWWSEEPPANNYNDGGHHDGWNDLYYFAGRINGTIYRYDPTNTTWATLTEYSTSDKKYGISKDPSSNYFVSALRERGFQLHNGANGQIIDTYAESNISTTQAPFDSEDVIIGWTGDAYTFRKGTGGNANPVLQRWVRTG